MGMDASWQLRWQSAGPAFVEHVVAADGLHWITAGEVAPTGELRVWQQDHSGLVYELQLEDAEAAMLTVWVSAPTLRLPSRIPPVWRCSFLLRRLTKTG
jgi:hypothetical protein